MITMQYTITLPADYNMEIIRKRVEDRGHLFDSIEHLKFKAFLITEKGQLGNRKNCYAPFYLWHSELGMHTFLLGEGFTKVISDFGWQPVNLWTLLDFSPIHEKVHPKFAIQELINIYEETDLTTVALKIKAYREKAFANPHLYSLTIGFNPTEWKVLILQLVNRLGNTISGKNKTVYEILHLSENRTQRS